MTASMILEHLSLVVAALIFAVLAGVPLGILCHFYPAARKIVLRVVDLIQTTPALALLGIIMVFIGPGKPTVIVGLALYSLLPIVRNTCLGLDQVPEHLIEAGRGMGMTRTYRLVHVEIPIAAPIIFTGIRIAAVNAIGTAVFASFVGGGGLGSVITTGIRAGAAALWGDTAQLPEVEITRPDTILGTNTKTCMQAGLYYTFLGGVERTIRQFRKELGGEDFKVITTGGLGRVFENDTELIDVYDPDLIFKGMAHIYSRNVK